MTISFKILPINNAKIQFQDEIKINKIIDEVSFEATDSQIYYIFNSKITNID